MKIITSTTTIECDAEELRQSNDLSDAFTGMLRRAFNGTTGITQEEKTDGNTE